MLLNPDAMPPWLAKVWPASQFSKKVLAGVNDDDCAVMEWTNGLLVVTTDFLNARPVVSELGIGDMKTLGRLVVAANLSDLCGSGAKPEAMLIAVTMPRTSDTADFRRLISGIRSESKKWNVPVIGGDTKLGSSLAILGVALGSAKGRRNLFLKNGARPEDLLWASGELGSCSAAVLGLHRGDMNKQWKKWAIGALKAPKLPLTKSRAVSDARVGKGGIDISDGLGSDLSKLCKQSGVGVVLEAARIPISTPAKALAKKERIPPWALPFGLGGEFQFVVTTGQEAKSIMESLGFTLIGKLNRTPKLILKLPDCKTIPLPNLGHSDSRNKSFYEEARILLNNLPTDAIACNK